MSESVVARFLRRMFVAILLGAVASVMLLHGLDGARGARLEMLQRHHDRLSSVNNRISRDNGRLADELHSLEEGVAGWRDVARREHGMLREGEVVFRFPVSEP